MKRTYCEPWEENVAPHGKDRLWILLVVIVLVLAMGLTAVWFLTVDVRAYMSAIQVYRQGEYAQAAERFSDLSDYRNAEQMYTMSRWNVAEEQFVREEYLEAIAIYETLNGYENSSQRILESYYALGEKAESEDQEQALEYFILAQDYADAPEKRSRIYYDMGHAIFLAGDLQGAEECFTQMETEYGKPHFWDFDQLRASLEDATEQLQESVECFVYEMPEDYDEINERDALWGAVGNVMAFQTANCYYYSGTHKFKADVTYYPGQRIVYAWRTGDESILTEAEKQTYAIALDLVAQAQASSQDPMEQLLWLHDWLCANNEYRNPDMMVTKETFLAYTELNCVGALQHGYINCQGYTDGFYLLGTLAGFDVCRIAGTSEEVGHCWNGVTIGDDLFMVDVTYDDLGSLENPEDFTYIWFNCAWDPDLYQIDSPELFDNLVTDTDFSQSYYNMADAVYEDLDAALLAMLEQHAEEGDVWTHTVVTGEEYTSKDVYNAIGRNMGKAGYRSVSWYEYICYYAGDTYISILWA